jgi:DNA-binding transcriptional LysR family regulator
MLDSITLLDLVQTFCVVVECRAHISKAAQSLQLSQPSVSMKIRRLERYLKYKLFEKKGTRLNLTLQGQTFYRSISGYAQSLTQFKSIIDAQAGHQVHNKSLSVLGNMSSFHYLLPKISKHFLDNQSDVQLTLNFGETNQAIEWLHSGDIDIALLPHRAFDEFPKDCEYFPIFFFTPCLITKKDHPLAGKKNLTIQEIAKYNLILPSPDLIVIPNLYEIFPQNQEAKTLKLQMKNIESGRKFVESGLAITISSDIILDEDDPYLVGTSLAHLLPFVNYGILLSKKRNMPQYFKAFKDSCDAVNQLYYKI